MNEGIKVGRARGQQIVLRRVEVSYLEATEEEGKLKKVTEILSEAVYAHLRQKEPVHKGSALKGKEKRRDYGSDRPGLGRRTQEVMCDG